MSHDLQFHVQNPDGSFAGPAGHDAPLPPGVLQQFPPAPPRPYGGGPPHMMPGQMGGNVPMAPPPNNNSATGGFQSQTVADSVAGAVNFISSHLRQSSHPVVIVFHVFFKALAFFCYLFGNWLIGGRRAEYEGARFISLMVICILLLAADFWVVKNITGRLLVGLRWWNKVENDTTTWIFESAEQMPLPGGRPRMQINPFDRSVFWTVLYFTPALWSLFFVWDVITFKFQWLLIVGMALALSCANVYGYYKCSSDQSARFQQMMQQGAQQGAMALVRSNVLSYLTGQTAVATPNNNNNNMNNNNNFGGGSHTFV